MVIYKANYEHIFFDRFIVDKEKEARFIISKALDEMECNFSEENMVFTIENADFNKEMELEKLCDTLKREFFIILKEQEAEKPAPVKHDFSHLVSYVRQNYLYDTLTIQEICEKTNFSRNEADRIFLKEFNMTVSEYIRTLRTQKAGEMLVLGHSVEECASLCGFGSVKTMQRAFKKVYNATPAEYRESCTMAPNLDSNDA